MCRPQATSSWASRSHSAHFSACRPLRNSCRRPSATAAATAHRLCTKCCHALKHLDGHCWLGTDLVDQGDGPGPPAPGSCQGLGTTHVAFQHGGAAPHCGRRASWTGRGRTSLSGWLAWEILDESTPGGRRMPRLTAKSAGQPHKLKIPGSSSPHVPILGARRVLPLKSRVPFLHQVLVPRQMGKEPSQECGPRPQPTASGLTQLAQTPGPQCFRLCSGKQRDTT